MTTDLEPIAEHDRELRLGSARYWLVHDPALGAPIRRYGHRTVPFILIGFGILILWEAGTLKLI